MGIAKPERANARQMGTRHPDHAQLGTNAQGIDQPFDPRVECGRA